MLWAFLSILSGFAWATSDTVVKKYLAKEKAIIIVWSRFAFASLFLLLMLPFIKIPKLDITFLDIVPYMIALKRTSSVFGVGYGWLIFKEKGIKERALGTLLMVLGAVLIVLF